jgi:hypothetical protein
MTIVDLVKMKWFKLFLEPLEVNKKLKKLTYIIHNFKIYNKR